MQKSKVLGILGGLGPMATVYFYQLVTAHTKATKDQDHIDMVIASKATTPDRTAFILGQSQNDPFAVMEAEAKKLVAYGAEVIALPCNTAHYFYDRLNNAVPVPVLNMVEDTVGQVKQMGSKKVGILATDGTIQTGTYQRVCQAAGLPCAVLGTKGQQDVMRVIYEDIKSGGSPNMQRFNKVAEELFAAGCDTIILGCTELSLVKKEEKLDGRFVDSMEVLASAAIRACGKTGVGFSWQQAAAPPHK